jgi:acetolactate synthase I/II/III large subunit
MKAHQVIARTLADLGVEHLFGLMGDANMLYVADFQQLDGRRYVGAITEGAALSMADGYSRVKGQVGVCTVTHGPGATNTLTALTEASRARSSVLLMTGSTPVSVRRHNQQVDLAALATVAGVPYLRCGTAADLRGRILEAYLTATQSRTPVLLDLPVDAMFDNVDYEGVAMPLRLRLPSAAGIRDDSETFDDALGLIASARRPLLLAGRGAVVSKAGPEIAALADQVGGLLATSLLARGLFDGHPFDLGVLGTIADERATKLASQADLVVSFGAALNQFTTLNGWLFENRKVIQCDIDSTRFGYLRHADVELIGDARETAVALREIMEHAGSTASVFRSNYEAAGPVPDRNAEIASFPETPGMVDTRAAMIALDRVLPGNRVVVTDCGRFMSAPWRYLSAKTPESFVHTANFGSIGLGIATAVGASFAETADVTVVVAGDGGGMMGLAEFQTAVRESRPMVFVILNDNSYGSEYEELEKFGVDPSYSLLRWPSFVDLAVAMGGRGMRVSSLAELDKLGDDVFSGDLPLLIEIPVDPAVHIGSLR